jgi:ribonuclease III
MEVVPGPPRSVLDALLGTKIKDINLYIRAFTHKSALKRFEGLTSSYETLEFMGDSVLGFVVTKFLFDKHEREQEGFLTKARTKMVRGTTLATIAQKLNFDKWIIMDEKGMRNGWNTNPKILEDVLEAFIGAVYLDLGMVHAKRFILDSFEKVETNLVDDNYKDQLMRWCQAEKLALPEYRVDAHNNGTFMVTVIVDAQELGCGFASTKKQAEQNAAQLLLKTDQRFKKNGGQGCRIAGAHVCGSAQSGVAGTP